MDERLKEDFSIEWLHDQYVSRREFFKFLTLASGGMAAGSAALALWPRRDGVTAISLPRQRICSLDELAVGGSIGFRYPEKDDLCLLVRTRSGELLAYSRRCTHLSCPVQYQADKERLYCPCHNGAFSVVDGKPTQGPPTRPLRQILLEVEGEDVYAVGMGFE